MKKNKGKYLPGPAEAYISKKLAELDKYEDTDTKHEKEKLNALLAKVKDFSSQASAMSNGGNVPTKENGDVMPKYDNGVPGYVYNTPYSNTGPWAAGYGNAPQDMDEMEVTATGGGEPGAPMLPTEQLPYSLPGMPYRNPNTVSSLQGVNPPVFPQDPGITTDMDMGTSVEGGMNAPKPSDSLPSASSLYGNEDPEPIIPINSRRAAPQKMPLRGMPDIQENHPPYTQRPTSKVNDNKSSTDRWMDFKSSFREPNQDQMATGTMAMYDLYRTNQMLRDIRDVRTAPLAVNPRTGAADKYSAIALNEASKYTPLDQTADYADIGKSKASARRMLPQAAGGSAGAGRSILERYMQQRDPRYARLAQQKAQHDAVQQGKAAAAYGAEGQRQFQVGSQEMAAKDAYEKEQIAAASKAMDLEHKIKNQQGDAFRSMFRDTGTMADNRTTAQREAEAMQFLRYNYPEAFA